MSAKLFAKIITNKTTNHLSKQDSKSSLKHNIDNKSHLPIIPIMHCFDSNYCLAAAVSFYSMLEHASKDYFYKLYVVHSGDISQETQDKLAKAIKSFPNATLEFINKSGLFDKSWERTYNKGHFSKDMFYKICVASIFPQYDKIIITDVDVVWRGDISREFSLLDLQEDYYIGGYNAPLLKQDCPLTKFMDYYDFAWSSEEKQRIFNIGAGLIVCNLKKLREDNIEQKFFEFLESNLHRIVQPEQDVLNYVCYPKIKILSHNGMVSSYFWRIFDSKEKLDNATWDRENIEYALNNPVQIHYAGPHVKPWKDFDTLKGELWFESLAKTNYLKKWLKDTYKEFKHYKLFYEENKDNEIYPRFKRILYLGFLFELAKRKGIIKMRMLNIKIYFDFSGIVKIFRK